MKLAAMILAIGLLLIPMKAVAGDDFDGTGTLLCANIEAMDCSPGVECEKGLAENIGAPQFMRIDFAKKEVIGPKRTKPIRLMEKSDEQILLFGKELGLGWVIALHRSTGKISVSLISGEGAFVIFGACTR